MKHSNYNFDLRFFEQARPAVFQMQKTRQGPSGPVEKKLMLLTTINNNKVEDLTQQTDSLVPT